MRKEGKAEAEAEAASSGASQVASLASTKEGTPEQESDSPAVSDGPRALPRPPERARVDYDEEDEDDDALEALQLRQLLPRIPGLVGTPWAWRLPRVAGGGGGAEGKAERTREVIMRMIDRNERQQILFIWRLNATRAKASALAVWAVDQGNRKAYEVERSLMAENRLKF
jgi:hypothetical protein